MGRVFAVADLHGVYPLWEQISNYLQEDDKIFVLGDCGDRCRDGWKLIKEVLRDPRAIYIRGNHDQFILDAWRSEWRDTYLWFCNGGYETYDSVLQDENSEIYLIELSKTKLYHCYENKNGQRIHLSHAGFTLMENNVIPHNYDLLWDRYHITDGCGWWPESNPNDYVVHGHTWCGSRSTFGHIETQLNDNKTVGRYCHGRKICIDGRSFRYGRCALLDLDTLTEIEFSIPNFIV